MLLRPAIFFDRDLTLIAGAPAGLRSPAAHAPEHVVLLPGALDAIRLVRAAGHLVVVVTNQPGAAKGQYSIAQILATHAELERQCATAGASIDAIYFCPHHEVGHPSGDLALVGPCACRKPKPGLLLLAARELGIDLPRSTMIGDDEGDIAAGLAAGTRAIRVGPAGLSVLDAARRALAIP